MMALLASWPPATLAQLHNDEYQEGGRKRRKKRLKVGGWGKGGGGGRASGIIES